MSYGSIDFRASVPIVNNSIIIYGNSNILKDIKKHSSSNKACYIGPFNDSKHSHVLKDWEGFYEILFNIILNQYELYSDKEYKSPLVFSFNSFFPVPRQVTINPYLSTEFKKIIETHPRYIINMEYPISGEEWEISNWGCKGNYISYIVTDIYLFEESIFGKEQDNFIEYKVISEQAPPILFLKKLSALYPSVTIELTYMDFYARKEINHLSFQKGIEYSGSIKKRGRNMY